MVLKKKKTRSKSCRNEAHFGCRDSSSVIFHFNVSRRRWFVSVETSSVEVSGPGINCVSRHKTRDWGHLFLENIYLHVVPVVPGQRGQSNAGYAEAVTKAGAALCPRIA